MCNTKVMFKLLLVGLIAIFGLLLASDILKQDEPSIFLQDQSVSSVEQIQITQDNNTDMPVYVDVVLTNDNGQQPYRSSFQVKSDSKVTIIAGDIVHTYGAGTVITKEMLAGLFVESPSIQIVPEENRTLYLMLADTKEWSAAYRGSFIIHKTEDTYWIVNQVLLEEYLLGVVPGEMPERFSLEALKAQAICARTYVCNMLQSDAYDEYFADVDDSVNCQVYNKHGENEKATKAVNDTAGVVLLENSEKTNPETLDLAEVYYFSTSCGYTTGLEAWQEVSLPYLTSVSTLLSTQQLVDWNQFLKSTDIKAYDEGSNYFRWKGEILIPDGYKLTIKKREASGIVTELTMESKHDKQIITTEHEIRSFLGQYMIMLTDKYGESIPMEILPSAWFVLEQGNIDNHYMIYGGGYGHGIGMSQYGAHGMALQGMCCEEILLYYFPGTRLT